jgi:hypothetical protein
LKDDIISKADLKNWPLPDEYLIELGRISCFWISLEQSLEIAIGKLAGFELDDYRSFIFLRHTSFPQKLDIFETLCEGLQLHYSHLKDYKVISKRIRSVQTQRNKFVHNAITKNSEGDGFLLTEGSARGRIKTSIKSIDHKELKKLSMEMHIVYLALHEFITGVKYTPKWDRSK